MSCVKVEILRPARTFSEARYAMYTIYDICISGQDRVRHGKYFLGTHPHVWQHGNEQQGEGDEPQADGVEEAHETTDLPAAVARHTLYTCLV